jgi:hypothetical protein
MKRELLKLRSLCTPDKKEMIYQFHDPTALTPGKETPAPFRWVGSKAGLDFVEKRDVTM